MKGLRALRTSAALTAAVVVLSWAVAGAGAETSFTDAVGDPSEQTAPDISGVQVADSPDGTLTFRVTIANYQTLPLFSAVAIGLDVDRKKETGSDGMDAVLGHVVTGPVAGAETLLARWDASKDDLAGVDPLPSTVTSSFAGGVLTMTVPRSEVFHASGFRFAVASLAFDESLDDPAFDLAPDADTWAYDVVLPPVVLAASAPMTLPRQPRAGKVLLVSTKVVRTDKSPTAPGLTATCSARVGSKRLRTSASFVPVPETIPLGEGQARCAFLVPKTAKGKLVRGSLTASTTGASVTKPFSFRVR